MIRVEKLGFKHRLRTNWIFRDHSLTVNAGEVVAVIGPNGRGKTTLIKTILGLYKSVEGSVSFDGSVGYVPQNTEASFPYSVRDMVVMGRARHVKTFGSPGRDDYHKADAALERLGVGRFADRPVTELSGGERQLVLIARALVSECQIMVLDEPASALDFRNQQTILTVLRDLAQKDGMTILFTTHMPQHAQVIADQVLLMRDVDHYDFGPTKTVLSEENLSTLYGIDIRSIGFDHQGQNQQAVVPVFV
ncbi:ABC transporter ATP-binding protein [Thalassospira sp.]|uniref:ABC transporter ATP-binding protein n=1 Tax=Thalassospira sp. TaxID=1912094 RepID=UPI0032ED7830